MRQEGDELPDRRRHGYADLERQLNQHAREIEERLNRFFSKALIAFAVIGMTSALALAGYGLVLRSEARQNELIQDQRREFVRFECEDVNTRNRNSTKALEAGAGQDIANATTQEAKDEIARRRDVTLVLIDRVLPIRDCDSLVRLATTGGGED